VVNMKDDPIPKSLQNGPKPPEPEKIDGWFRAALKRCWPHPKYTPLHERPWRAVSYRMVAIHIDKTTPGGLR